MARRKKPLEVNDPKRQRPFETLAERRRRLERTARGEYKYRGVWMTRPAIVAAILSNKLMRDAVVEPYRRGLFWGGESFIRVTVPGTGFELLLRQEPELDETFDEFMAQVRALMAER